MRNKIFYFAVGAIASLAMIGTITHAFATAAMPGLEVPKSDLITSESAPTCPNPKSVSKSVEINHVIFSGGFVLVILGGLCLAAFNYKNLKYQRQLTLQEQIQLLEKIWKMTPQR